MRTRREDLMMRGVMDELFSWDGLPEFDSGGIPFLEAVQAAIAPVVRRFGWRAVNDAMLLDPLWQMRDLVPEIIVTGKERGEDG